MKVLYIGKSGITARFTEPNDFTRSVELIEMPANLPVEEYLRLAGDAEYIISDAMTAVPAELIQSLPSLKLIHSNGVGYNYIDVPAASARGIYVCNCKGVNAKAVAEHTVMLMVNLLRDAVNADRATREGRQIEVKSGYLMRGDLPELSDCSIGLVGFGDIAKALVKLLHAYEVTEIYYNKRTPLSPEEEAEYGIKYLPLEELLSRSDIVSLHAPATAQTAKMANDSFFSSMRDGSYLVNTARGELVDDEALIRALRSGKIKMAGLDTLDNEPTRADHPLVTLEKELADRLIFSPHIGGVTGASLRRAYAAIWKNIELCANGEKPTNVVNKC